MKRVLSLVLALSMVLSMFTFSSAASLSDIEGKPYEAAVEALVELGVVNGYPDGTFLPNNVVTRAELAKLLVTAFGLTEAAEVASKETPFSDVANHWAAGYINVSADYKFVNGYPDGTFRPDETVTYAEAVTMCLRVLGYANEIDSKGTWPTNYIAKAKDLKLMKDVEYKDNYNDGATRGNVAILVWNMLRTQMWEITGESEGDGLVSEPNRLMINVKFSDYQYYDTDLEFYVEDIDVKDGEVKVTLNTDKTFTNRDTLAEIEKIAGKAINLEEDAEFLDLFGRTVAVLYNEDENEFAILTPSAEDKVYEDNRYYLDKELDGDYDFSSGEEYVWGTGEVDEATHTVAVVGSRKVVDYYTSYAVKAGVVDSVKTVKDKTTVKFSYGDLANLSDLEDDVIVLYDGKWEDPTAIKEGDVVTELVKDELYAITRKTTTGSFDEVKDEIDLDEADYLVVVVDGKAYKFVRTFEVVEIDEDGDDKTETDLVDIMDAKKDDDEYKFYDEDATLYFNCVGEVIRIEFEEVEDIEKTGHFYVLTNAKNVTWDKSDKDGTTTYVELNGESYEVKANVDVVGEPGDVVYVKFDSKDRVKECHLVPTENLEDYTFVVAEGEDDVLDDKNYIQGVKVTSSTTVFTITPVEDDDDDEIIDHYEVETSKGTDALKGVKRAIVAVKADDNFDRAEYVFVWDDAESDEMYGIVTKYTYSKGTVYLTIDGDKLEVDEDEEVDETIVGALVIYVETSSDTIKLHAAITAEDLEDMAYVVEKVDSELVKFTSGAQFDLDAFEDDIDNNCEILLVEASDDDEGYKLDSVEVLDGVSKLNIKKDDRVVIVPDEADYGDIQLFILIKGMD